MKRSLISKTFFQWASLVLIACLFWGLRQECLQADATDAICLASATPVFTFVKNVVGGVFFPWSLEEYYRYVFFGALAFLTLLFTWLTVTKKNSWWIASYFVAVCLCTYGELMSIRLQPSLFLALYSGGLIVVAVALYLTTRTNGPPLDTAWLDPVACPAKPRWYEIVGFTVLTVVIAGMRFYSVNRGYWDAEMCGHRPVVASWELMIQQELGNFSQQASGLSWVVAHHFLTRYEDPYYFFLDQRLLGAGISLVNCWLVYFFMRYLAGPFAAFAGLIFLGFGPVEAGWARGPTLHHLPLSIGLLTMWWCCKAFHERTWRAFIAVALLIPLTKYFYPSVRLIALGPFLGLAGVLIWHRKEWRGDKRKLLLIVVGGLLYLFSRSLLSWYTTGTFRWIFPFEQVQPIHGEGSLLRTLLTVVKDIPALVHEIFLVPRISDHYTPYITVPPALVLPSLPIIFAGLALVRLLYTARSPLALLWMGALVGGAVPTLLTGLGQRRFAFTIIAVSLLAILELAWFLNHLLAPRTPRLTRISKAGVLILSALCLWFLQASVMFPRQAERPHQLNFIEAVRPFVTPDTLVVQLETANPCPFFYGIYDLLQKSEGRIGYVYCLDIPGGPTEVIMNPRITIDTWQYRHTALASQASIVKARRDWARLLYVFYSHPTTAPWQQMLKERYPKGFGREIPPKKTLSEASPVYIFETPWEP